MAFLRDIGVSADKSIVSEYKGGFVGRFSVDACCCISLFLSLIHNRIQTVETKKIAITFTNDQHSIKEKHHLFPEEPDVLIFTWLFPFADYVRSSDTEKKRLLFSSISECVVYLGKQYGWDVSTVKEARKKAEMQNYKFQGFFKHSWASPDSQYRIRIYYDFGIKFIEYYGCLFKNRTKKEVTRKYFNKTVPVQGAYFINKSSGKWISNTEFELIAPTFQDEKWKIDVSEFV